MSTKRSGYLLIQLKSHASKKHKKLETNTELFNEAHRAVNVPMCCFLNTELFLKSRTALSQENEKTFVTICA